MRSFGDQGAEEDESVRSMDDDVCMAGGSEDDNTTADELDGGGGGALELETTGAADEDEAGGVTTAVVVLPRLKIQIRPMMTITATMMIIQVFRFMRELPFENIGRLS